MLAQALECGTCGKVFAVRPVPDAPPATLPDLDLGRGDARALAVAPDVTPDLDLGRSAPVAVAPDVTPELDLGRSPAVGAVQFERPLGLEQNALAPREWTPEGAQPVTCRACGAPQVDLSTIFCAHCGRRLPVRQIAMGSLILEGDAPPVDAKVRCLACGAHVSRAALCSDCGVPLRATE